MNTTKKYKMIINLFPFSDVVVVQPVYLTSLKVNGKTHLCVVLSVADGKVVHSVKKYVFE